MTEQDYKALENLKNSRLSVDEKVKKAEDELKEKKARAADAQWSYVETDDKELELLQQEKIDKTLKERMEAEDKLKELKKQQVALEEQERRVEADLAMVTRAAQGVEKEELAALRERETVTRRIFELRKQFVEMGKSEVEAGKKAAQIASVEAAARAREKAQATAEGLRGVFAEMLIKDAQLRGTEDEKVRKMQEQLAVQKRVVELKNMGLKADRAAALAAKEAQLARQQEAKTRAENLAVYDAEMKVRELRKGGKSAQADKQEAIIKVWKRAREMQEQFGMDRREAYSRAVNEHKLDAPALARNTKAEAYYAELRRTKGNLFRQGETAWDFEKRTTGKTRYELPVQPYTPSYNDVWEGGFGGGFDKYVGGRGRAGASGAEVNAPTGGGVPDLAGTVDKSVSAGANAMAAAVDALGTALNTKFSDIATKVETITEQVKNGRA
jgi:hypothetical protein